MKKLRLVEPVAPEPLPGYVFSTIEAQHRMVQAQKPGPSGTVLHIRLKYDGTNRFRRITVAPETEVVDPDA